MKKILTTLFFGISCVLMMQAQTKDEYSTTVSSVIVNINSNYTKAITETARSAQNHTTYAYMEGAWSMRAKYGDTFYTQLFHEQKFWERPLFLHVEFRGFLSDNQFSDVWYAGGAYCIYSSSGFIAFEPLYRWGRTEGNGYQFSVVGGWEWNRFELAQFTDLWGCSSNNQRPDNLYSETRAYYKISSRVRAGIVGMVTHYHECDWEATAFLGIKVLL